MTPVQGAPVRYFVVEPLDDGQYQIWKVELKRLFPGQEPDDEGVHTTPDGREWCWRWTRIGLAIEGTMEQAKIEAYKLWY